MSSGIGSRQARLCVYRGLPDTTSKHTSIVNDSSTFVKSEKQRLDVRMSRTVPLKSSTAQELHELFVAELKDIIYSNAHYLKPS